MTTTMPNLEELQATQRLLQDAHDYIETHGFDVGHYGSEGGPCCYIGTLRVAAGLETFPGFNDPADHGDGPELTYAFEVLDRLVAEQLDEDAVDAVKEYDPHLRLGRWIERYGFIRRDMLMGEHGYSHVDRFETEEALQIFRRALTEVYEQIEEASSGN